MGVSHKPHPQSSPAPSTASDTPCSPLQYVHTHTQYQCVWLCVCVACMRLRLGRQV